MSNFYDSDDLLWDSQIGSDSDNEEHQGKHKSKRNKHRRRQLLDLKRQQGEPLSEQYQA
ncbi:hypothetical protein Sps_02297 [Shewanella psychrophila]|uniref:Uncharacterized protein n=1 Tax=Shewanella psychrophila TaxID=225848 RepID=A0A1S6HPK4_9GAMM|nr:hypothetical protein [Shewanella psychrophila]AQS37455.1 hypothetical protein Sps_02297 [Shewanella psychrophila]